MARKHYKKYDDEKAKLDVLFLIFSLIVAGGVGFLAYACYIDWSGEMMLPLAVGLTFLVFGSGLLILLLLMSMLFKRFKEYVMTGERKAKKALLPLLGVILGVAVLAGGFQLLYGMNIIPGKSFDYTSHIYLIDNSASMDGSTGSDPNKRRYSAIDELIAGKDEDFPYMIYSFASDVAIEREMGPANANVRTYDVDVGYLTNVDKALDRIYSDYENRVWDGGERPQVILITDGEISNYGLDPILNRYIAKSIPISTIHVAARNSDALIEIADKTGGQFVKVDDVELMNEALETAVNLTNERSLLSSRDRAGGGIVYAVVRVLMLTLLGSLLGYGILLAYGRHESGKLTLISMPIKALLTAVTFEVLTEWLSGPEPILCMGLFTLLGTAIVAKMKEIVDEEAQRVDYDDDYFEEARRIGENSSRGGRGRRDGRRRR